MINHSPPQESFEFQRTCSWGAKVRSQNWNKVFWTQPESLSLFCVKAAPPLSLGHTHSEPFVEQKITKNPIFPKEAFPSTKINETGTIQTLFSKQKCPQRLVSIPFPCFEFHSNPFWAQIFGVCPCFFIMAIYMYIWWWWWWWWWWF